MAEPGDAVVAASETAPASGGTPAGQVGGATEVAAGDEPARTSWFFYGLGLGLQTFLWFLLFLALVVAVAVGGQLTEFRYVGF
jgi:hypothetical protein